MTEVNRLLTLFEADTTSLKKGVNDANASLNSFAKKGKQSAAELESGMGKALGGIKAALGGIIAGFGLYKLGGIFNRLTSEIGNLYDKTQAIGISSKAFQELAAVAKGAGLSSDGLAVSLQKLKVSIGQASLGNETMNAAFLKLGINFKDLQQLAPDQQFLKVAEALRKIKDPSEQAALAQSLLGRASKEALGFINSNIPQAIEGYRKLGIEISDADRAMVDQFDDSRKLLGSAITGFGEQLVVQLTPAMQSVTDYILKWIADAGGISKIAANFKDLLVSAFESARSIANGIIDGIKSAVQSVSVLAQEFKISSMESKIFSKEYDQPLADPDSYLTSGQAFSAIKGGRPGFIGGLTPGLSNVAPDPELKTLKENLRQAKEVLETTLTPETAQTSVSPLSGLPVPSNALEALSEAAKKASDNLDSLSKSGNAFQSAFDSNSGVSEQIQRIVGGTEQKPIAKDADFDKLASDILQDIQEGADPNGASVKSNFNVLSSMATQSGFGGYNNAAQKGAVEELKKYIEQNGGSFNKPQEVKVKITVDKKGIIKAILTSDEGKGYIESSAKEAAAKEARGVKR